MILITGAAGKTGRVVIQALLDKGRHVRGLVRRQEQATLLQQLGVRETVVSDMGDQTALDQAALGVRVIYHICPNMHPKEALIGANVIRAAQAAGVERFVYHSVLHPQIETMAHHWQKLRVEEMLLESGLAFTILQPAAYMQNVLANWDTITNEGVYAVPYALDTRLSMVDLNDIAEVAANVLIDSGHEGAIYELSGSEVLSQREVATILGAQLVRPVEAETIPLDQWEQQARAAGLSSYAIEALMKMFLHYKQHDFWGNPQVLGWLLGRTPHTFAHFVERTIQERRRGRL